MSKTITRFFPSEFSKDGYNRSFIEKFIDAAMCIPDSEATERRITEQINQYLLSERMKTDSWNRKTYLISDSYRKMLELLDITALDMLDDSGDDYDGYTIDFKEEFLKLKPNVNIPALGKLYLMSYKLQKDTSKKDKIKN